MSDRPRRVYAEPEAESGDLTQRIEALKIDRSYVQGLLGAGRDAAMTSAMVALAQKLGLSVVAEGVESEEQLAMIRSFGCDHYQGFFRSPAVDPQAIVGLIRQR